MRPPSMRSRLKPGSGSSRGVGVRRQVYELTLDDLGNSPVWEFRLDEKDEKGQDESTVRPHTASGPLDPADRMFLVRAAFTLADGSRMQGYLTHLPAAMTAPAHCGPSSSLNAGRFAFGVAPWHPTQSVWLIATSCSRRMPGGCFRWASASILMNQAWAKESPRPPAGMAWIL
jgi:hypothetical protein